MLSTNIGVGLDTLITIDIRWYRSIKESLEALFSNVKLAPNVECFTAVWSFDDHVFGVDTTTENKPVIDLPVTLLCP